jgi:dihydroorotate dehydrogenase electron transfer subunit
VRHAPFGRRRAAAVGRREVGAYVVLSVADGSGPAPVAGQFYMLSSCERWGGGAGERPFLPRAFSVLGAGDGRLEFLLDDVGPGSHRLTELVVGDELWLVGPLGKPFPAPPGNNALLVGGGVGIAPLALLHQELGGAPALLGFRDGAHALGAELLADVTIATDDGSVGHRGRVTELLEPRLDSAVAVYACGPPAMLEAVRSLCLSAGVPAQLALESPMACGFGACYGCVVATRDGYKRVCVDGPVFDAATLEAVA